MSGEPGLHTTSEKREFKHLYFEVALSVYFIIHRPRSLFSNCFCSFADSFLGEPKTKQKWNQEPKKTRFSTRNQPAFRRRTAAQMGLVTKRRCWTCWFVEERYPFGGVQLVHILMIQNSQGYEEFLGVNEKNQTKWLANALNPLGVIYWHLNRFQTLETGWAEAGKDVLKLH